MASGFFAILDDIASLMDDIAVSSKIASQKTAGILGDDLAVNAEKATGFVSSRELPVLWAITKGSLLNKAILIPIALLLNHYFPIAIQVILVLGGLYLAFEGAEKIYEYLFHKNEKTAEATESADTDPVKAEKSKIRSAVKTDFILSIEIVIIALSTVLQKPLLSQVITVSIVAVLATVGVYGIVALIVRMDDAGFRLVRISEDKGPLSKLGHFLVRLLPIVIKCLGVIGTVALLLVSGGILAHNIPFLHHLLPSVPGIIKEFMTGLVAGSIMALIILGGKKLFAK